MLQLVNIRCKNTGEIHKIPKGANLEEIYELIELNLPYGCTSAKVNNKVEGLHCTIYDDKDIEFLDVRTESGMRTYTRSLFFILFKAVTELYPTAKLRIDTPVSKGYYCRLTGIEGGVTLKVVTQLREKMQSIIKANIPFHRITCPTEEAIALFQHYRLDSKVKLLRSYGELYTQIGRAHV